MQEIDYVEARKQKVFRTGQVLLFRSSGWISRIIRGVTYSPYNHAAFIVCIGNRILVSESQGGVGCRMAPLSSVLMWHRYNEVYLLKPRYPGTMRKIESIRRSLIDFALMNLGGEYNYMGLFRKFFRHLVFWAPPPLDDGEKKVYPFGEARVCSHHVASAFYHCAEFWRVCGEKRLDEVTPGDLAETTAFSRVGRLLPPPEDYNVELHTNGYS